MPDAPPSSCASPVAERPDYSEVCGCGERLHYTNPLAEASVRRLVAERGPTVLVQVDGTDIAYWVPRHFVALHGLKAQDLPYLADLYSWEQG